MKKKTPQGNGTAKIATLVELMRDAEAPMALRLEWLRNCSQSEDPAHRAVLEEILKDLSAGESATQRRATQKLLRKLEEIEAGPLRSGTFLHLSKDGDQPRAQIVFGDGSMAGSLVRDSKLTKQLQRGDTVWVDAQAKVVLARDPMMPEVGESVRLEARLDAHRVLVALRDRSTHVFYSSHTLEQQLDRGEVNPGQNILVCPQRKVGFQAVPRSDQRQHYRFLQDPVVPQISVERDIGDPALFIDDLIDHVRLQLETPAFGERYRLQPCQMRLLSGVSGTGKSLNIEGFVRRLLETVAEITDVSIDELPSLVMRLRLPQIQSKWYGEAEKNLDQFFEEMEELALRTVRTADGRDLPLPLAVIVEEADGFGRQRGNDHIQDRLQTVLLQRLDTTTQKLRDRLILFLFTTNVPDLMDIAFLRRAGGEVERFGRLDRDGLVEILDKHLRHRPLFHPGCNGDTRETVVLQAAEWLFHEQHQSPGLVEIHLTAGTKPLIKRHRDFLTGALIDRAVQQAARQACFEERAGVSEVGISLPMIMHAMHDQVVSIVDQLQPHNATSFLTLPEGAHVASVRRLERPSHFSFDLERIQ